MVKINNFTNEGGSGAYKNIADMEYTASLFYCVTDPTSGYTWFQYPSTNYMCYIYPGCSDIQTYTIASLSTMSSCFKQIGSKLYCVSGNHILTLNVGDTNPANWTLEYDVPTILLGYTKDMFKLGSDIFTISEVSITGTTYYKLYKYVPATSFTLIESLTTYPALTGNGIIYNGNYYYTRSDTTYKIYKFNGTSSSLHYNTGIAVDDTKQCNLFMPLHQNSYIVYMLFDIYLYIIDLLSNTIIRTIELPDYYWLTSTGITSSTSSTNTNPILHSLACNNIFYSITPIGLINRFISDKSYSIDILLNYNLYRRNSVNDYTLQTNLIGNVIARSNTDSDFTVKNYLLTSQQLQGDKIKFKEESGVELYQNEVIELYDDDGTTKLGDFANNNKYNDIVISEHDRISGVQLDLDRVINVSFSSKTTVEMIKYIIWTQTGYMWENLSATGSTWSLTLNNKSIRDLFKIFQNKEKKLIRISRTGEVTFTAVASLPSTGLTLSDTNILELTSEVKRISISEVHLIGIGITSNKYSTSIQNQTSLYDYYPISDQTVLDSIAQSILDTKSQSITTLYVQVNAASYFKEYGQSITVDSTYYDIESSTWYITKCAIQDDDTVMFELQDVVIFQNERTTSDAEPLTRIEAKADSALGKIEESLITSGTKTQNLLLKDNEASALDIKEGSNSYLKFVTTNSGEKIVVGKDIDFADTKGISTTHDAIINAATSHKVKCQVNGTSIVEHEETKSTNNQNIDFADGKGISATHDAIINAATSHSVKLQINGSNKITTDGTDVDFGSQNLKAYKFPGLVAERLSRNKSYSPLNTNANYRIALESTSGNNPVMNSKYITSFGNNRTTFQVAVNGYYLVTVQAFFLAATQYHHLNFGYYPTSSTTTNLNTIDRIAWTNNGVVCRGSFIVYLSTGKDYGFWVYNSNTSGDYDIYNSDDCFQTASVCFMGVAP